jgi:ketosteroid isomerase-like protein
MSENHPARVAGERSRSAVARGVREEWLALFDDDALVEDPIGVSPLDPTGKGHRGKAAIAAFWDNVIMRVPGTRISFDYHTQYAVGDECACVGSLTNHFANGASYRVEGVFVYRVNAAGKLVSLRTYWEHAKGTFRAPEGAGRV